MHRAQGQYSTPDASKILGVPLPRIIDWMEKGYVVPDYATAEGPGSRRLLSLKNLIELGILKALFDKGLKPHGVRKLMQAVRSDNAFGSLYDWRSFAAGMDSLGGLRISTTNLLTGTVPRERDVEHVGSLWWIESWLPGLVTGEEALSLLLFPVPLPLGVVPLAALTEGRGRVDTVFGIDLGEIERRVYEATAE